MRKGLHNKNKDLFEQGLLQCRTCKTVKTTEHFVRDGTRKYGFKHLCKECSIEARRAYDYKYSYRKQLPPLTTNVCEICASDSELCRDHNHQTNEIRGTLCRKCNAALGLFGDNEQNLQRAIWYLQERGSYATRKGFHA